MDSESTPPAATVTAVPLPASPLPEKPVSSPQTAITILAEVRQAWPRSAQLATAFLLGIALTLLAFQTLSRTRLGTRPMELERSGKLTYRVDLNQARRAELLQLPGIGSHMAQRLEDYRESSGGFQKVDDLTRVKGFGPATLERLRPWVAVDAKETRDAPGLEIRPTRTAPRNKPSTSAPSKSKKAAALTGPIDVNRASEEELRRLPGIGPKLSQRILDEREKRPFKTVEELRRVPGIGPKILDRLRPFVTVQGATARIASAE